MNLSRPEQLELRNMMSSVPFGATSQDVAEYMLGDVVVNVVLLESDGTIDADTEQWTPELIAPVIENIREGLQWWTDALAEYNSVHQLRFEIDTTFVDSPAQTGYEPISRNSQDFVFWIEEFFRQADVPSSPGFSTEIREFNHRQRIAHQSDWSFTIFVVNGSNDPNGMFGVGDGSQTQFRRAFAYSGGQFIVMPHNRPAATVAHETAHMFWAMDEYSNGAPHTNRRGYYNTANSNSRAGRLPGDTFEPEPSIMASTGSPYTNHQISQSARESLGWRDSDGDGIFDVLDVPHLLSGQTEFHSATRTVQFQGSSQVQTLPNRNSAGTGNDITINRLTHFQYQVDDGPWLDLAALDGHLTTLDATTPPLPATARTVNFRTIDDRIGVTSNEVSITLPTDVISQNPANRMDVNADQFVSPLDVLLIISWLNNSSGSPIPNGPPYLDVSGDGFITPLDVLQVIQFINANPVAASPAPQQEESSTNENSGAAEGEPTISSAAAGLLFADKSTDDELWALCASDLAN